MCQSAKYPDHVKIIANVTNCSITMIKLTSSLESASSLLVSEAECWCSVSYLVFSTGTWLGGFLWRGDVAPQAFTDRLEYRGSIESCPSERHRKLAVHTPVYNINTMIDMVHIIFTCFNVGWTMKRICLLHEACFQSIPRWEDEFY